MAFLNGARTIFEIIFGARHLKKLAKSFQLFGRVVDQIFCVNNDNLVPKFLHVIDSSLNYSYEAFRNFNLVCVVVFVLEFSQQSNILINQNSLEKIQTM